MNTRIGVRISKEQRKKIESALSDRGCKTLSDFVKEAIDEKLKRETLASELFS